MTIFIFTDFATGREKARHHIAQTRDRDGFAEEYEVAEARAERIARREGCVVDICTAITDGDGNVVGRDRCGIRVSA